MTLQLTMEENCVVDQSAVMIYCKIVAAVGFKFLQRLEFHKKFL